MTQSEIHELVTRSESLIERVEHGQELKMLARVLLSCATMISMALLTEPPKPKK